MSFKVTEQQERAQKQAEKAQKVVRRQQRQQREDEAENWHPSQASQDDDAVMDHYTNSDAEQDTTVRGSHYFILVADYCGSLLPDRFRSRQPESRSWSQPGARYPQPHLHLQLPPTTIVVLSLKDQPLASLNWSLVQLSTSLRAPQLVFQPRLLPDVRTGATATPTWPLLAHNLLITNL